jgi:hypothetical protein
MLTSYAYCGEANLDFAEANASHDSTLTFKHTYFEGSATFDYI